MQTKAHEGRIRQNIDRLSKLIKEKKEQISKKAKCFPTMIVAGIIVPIVIWLILYFVQPEFVQVREGSRKVRSTTKVFYWTIIITVIIWAAMYLWVWCRGYDKISMICATR